MNEGQEVYGMINETNRSKKYLHGPVDEGTNSNTKIRTGDDVRKRRRGFREVSEEHEDTYKGDYGSNSCQARVHILAECPFYENA